MVPTTIGNNQQTNDGAASDEGSARQPFWDQSGQLFDCVAAAPVHTPEDATKVKPKWRGPRGTVVSEGGSSAKLATATLTKPTAEATATPKVRLPKPRKVVTLRAYDQRPRQTQSPKAIPKPRVLKQVPKPRKVVTLRAYDQRQKQKLAPKATRKAQKETSSSSSVDSGVSSLASSPAVSRRVLRVLESEKGAVKPAAAAAVSAAVCGSRVHYCLHESCLTSLRSFASASAVWKHTRAVHG